MYVVCVCLCVLGVYEYVGMCDVCYQCMCGLCVCVWCDICMCMCQCGGGVCVCVVCVCVSMCMYVGSHVHVLVQWNTEVNCLFLEAGPQ